MEVTIWRFVVRGLVLVVVLWSATEVFVWQNSWHASLGAPLWSVVYPPWGIVVWAWRWGWQAPGAFQWAGMTAGVLVCALARLCISPPTKEKEDAAWATGKELRQRGLIRREGIIMGAHKGQIIRHEAPGNVLIVGTTRSGKTTSSVVPSLLDGTEHMSVIVHEPKEPGEIYDATAGYRSTFSRVYRFRPLARDSHQYNPLAAVRLKTDYEIRDLQIVADMLTDPNGTLAKSENDAGAHFGFGASEFFVGVIAHGLYTWPHCTMGDVYQLVSNQKIETLVEEMKGATHVGGICHPAVARACLIFEETAERELSAFVNTARRALRLWADPLVCRATERSDFRLHDLREGDKPISLYLSIPFADQARLRPLSRLVVRQFLEYTTAREDGWRFPLLGMIDEFPALGYFPLLGDMLNYCLGMGVMLSLATPSMNAIEHVWGPYHPFLEGTSSQLVFALRQRKIADLFTSRIGTRMVSRQRVSRTPGQRSLFPRTTVSTDEREEPLFPATALLGMRKDTVLVFLDNMYVQLKKTYYFKHKTWLKRSRMKVQP